MSGQDILVLVVGGVGLVGAGVASVRASRRRRREALFDRPEVGELAVIRPPLSVRPMSQTMVVEVLPRKQGYLLGAKLYAPGLPRGFDLVAGSESVAGGRKFVRLSVPTSWLSSLDAAGEHGVSRYTASNSSDALSPPPPNWWAALPKTKARAADVERSDS